MAADRATPICARGGCRDGVGGGCSGAFLDRDRREELDSYLAEVGARYALRFDPSYGQAMSTYLYRVMRRRYPDFLRTTLGDNRSRGRGRRVPAGARFPLRELEGAVWDDNSGGLDEALATLGENLSEESRTTIREVAVPLAAGWKMPELAVALDVRQMDIEQRLERLREELGAVHEPAQSGHVVAAS